MKLKMWSVKIFRNPFFLIFILFLISIAVRFLLQQDTLFEAVKVQSTVVEFYRQFARFIVEDGFFSLFDASARVSNLELMAHPPGYSLLLALLFSIFGESNFVIQTVSIFFDALSAVLIFLIAEKLFSRKIAFVAGLLAALCPQFAFNSVLFLPDTLAIFPLLLAVYCFICAFQKPRLIWIVSCGVCLGLSCWLRANSLLMPIFFALTIFLLFEKKQKFYFSFALLAAFILTIAPITIRNAIVYRAFIPISLGAGQTMLEGIADYDTENRFGIPATDYGIITLEAEKYNRPDYATTLFGEDGIKRDRMRTAQGLQIIGENPFWFGKVMFLRALSMNRLERVLTVSSEIPITNALPENGTANAVWKNSGFEIQQSGNLISKEANFTNSDGKSILLTDNSKNGIQFSSAEINVKGNTDYLAEVVVKLKKGRISIKIVGAETGKVYSFSTINFEEWESSLEPPEKIAKIPFTVSRNENVKLSISNEPSNPPGALVEIGEARLFELGQTAFIWTKPFRFVIGNLQKLFITAIILPLALLGVVILFRQKKRKELIILVTIPIYYFCVQSILHTEYRYVMAIHCFYLIFAAFGIVGFCGWAFNKFKIFIERKPQSILS